MYATGKSVRFPPRVLYHVVAARYGTTPAVVRDWLVDDYLDALAFMEVTRGGQ